MNVFHESEPHNGCTESYVVRFWFKKPDGYSEQREERYFVKNSRRAHKNVEAKWKRDYVGKIIDITYE